MQGCGQPSAIADESDPTQEVPDRPNQPRVAESQHVDEMCLAVGFELAAVPMIVYDGRGSQYTAAECRKLVKAANPEKGNWAHRTLLLDAETELV